MSAAGGQRGIMRVALALVERLVLVACQTAAEQVIAGLNATSVGTTFPDCLIED
jgi:hypothetical protein